MVSCATLPLPGFSWSESYPSGEPEDSRIDKTSERLDIPRHRTREADGAICPSVAASIKDDMEPQVSRTFCKKICANQTMQISSGLCRAERLKRSMY